MYRRSYVYVMCTLLGLLALSSCTRGGSLTSGSTPLQARFDSCIRFIQAHSVDHVAHLDTIGQILQELHDMNPQELTEKQRRQSLTIYKTEAGHYLLANQLDKMLEAVIRGKQQAKEQDDYLSEFNFCSTLVGIYSSWRMHDQARHHIERMRALLPYQRDSLVMVDGLLMAAGAYCNEEKNDSALSLIRLTDALLKANPALKDRFPPKLHYFYPYVKGWVYSTIPDSAAIAIELLLPLRHQLEEKKRQSAGYEVICFNLGRAFTGLGQTQRAEAYYNEALQLVENRKDITCYDAVNWLMELYHSRDDQHLIMRLFPTWYRLTNDFYKWCTSSQLTAYYVQNYVAEKEQEVQRLTWELRLGRMANAFYLMAVCFLLTLCIAGWLFWRRRKRQMRILFEALIRRHLEWKDTIRAINLQSQLLLEQKESEESHDESTPHETSAPNDDMYETYHRLYQRTLLMMEQEMPFLNPHFTLDELSRLMCTNRTQMSFCINRFSHTNFNMWLAEYRVNYLLELYLCREKPETAMEELSAKAGFPSRTTFYRQFKQITGLTPVQFSRNLKSEQD